MWQQHPFWDLGVPDVWGSLERSLKCLQHKLQFETRTGKECQLVYQFFVSNYRYMYILIIQKVIHGSVKTPLMHACFIILLYNYVAVTCTCNILTSLRLDVRAESTFCEGSRGCWVKSLKNACLP